MLGPSAKGYLFADDLAICVSTPKSNLGNVLNIDNITCMVEDWCNANLLCLNLDKIQDLKVTYNNMIDCKDKDVVKFLGFNLDSKLNWVYHMDKLACKMSKGIFMIRKLRKIVSLDVLKIVYFAHIHSHISYGTLLWGSQIYSIKIFKLQKKCLRLMCGIPPRGHCRESFKSLKIMTVPALFVYQCLIYVKENYSSFVEHNMCHSYNTRGNNNLMISFYCYARTQKSFLNISIKLFNSLPTGIKHQQLETLKTTLKEFLTHNPIYDVGEFYDIVHVLG